MYISSSSSSSSSSSNSSSIVIGIIHITVISIHDAVIIVLVYYCISIHITAIIVIGILHITVISLLLLL